MTDERGDGSPTIRIVAKGATLPARQWVRVRLPFATSSGCSRAPVTLEFDPARLASIAFIQGLDDGALHTLLIDEVRIDDGHGETPESALSAPAG